MNTKKHLNQEESTTEIDLSELIRSLGQQWKLIAGVMAAVFSLAVVYVIVANPVYQAKSVLRVAELRDLDRLNLLDLYSLDREVALQQIGNELESYSTRLDFFRENPELFKALESPIRSLEQSFDVFNEDAFKVTRSEQQLKDGQQRSRYVEIVMEYSEGLDGPVILNNLVSYVHTQEQERVKSDVLALADNRIERLERQLNIALVGYQAAVEMEVAQLREQDILKQNELEDELSALRLELKNQRLNRLEKLNEAIYIATELGIKNPTTLTSLSQEQQQRLNANVIRAEINAQNKDPLYFMGTRALLAEKEILSVRESDDFMEPRIAQIYKELELLKNNRRVEMLLARDNEKLFLESNSQIRSDIARLQELKSDLGNLRLVRLDQLAVEPVAPVRPKRLLILLLSVVLGGILGVSVALGRSLLRQR